ncbi:rhamnan synthesis F family protein [Burkholderia multivorans]|uniref:rhamnan synthesis F family protein n=1 Tax=Burkholderia multivorans TaxID=87883 RepID=UPI001C241C5B|nr:rhamnan synthesis F family protein [Burkholderia multivorans]MBU9411745.1 hypothetical protein [Burkholderia multivorans]
MQSPHPMLDLDWIREASGEPNMSVSDCIKQQDIVGPNILFDTKYYRSTYGAEMPVGMTCLEHFCRQLRESPRDPNPLFSVKQWHETIGWRLQGEQTWRNELIRTLGQEARFSREELRRQNEGRVVVQDSVVGLAPKKGQDICLFVHYDKNDDVQPYVIDYLDALNDQGVSVMFLSNSKSLLPIAREKLRDRVWRIVNCENRAYDWGLYSIGVRLLGDDINGHSILLANDSVVGTMNPLDELFKLARSGEYQIVGAIESLLHDWHLQSFFIYCSDELVSSGAWADFWKAYRPHNDKWFVINSQKMGFARWMARRNVRMKGAWEYWPTLEAADENSASQWRRDLIKNRGITNPTVELWDVLLENGFPFLKRSILENELAAGNIAHMCNVLSRLSVRKGGREVTHS